MPDDVNFSKLPKMVGWFNPLLLVRALFHHLVAGIFGRFADQRVLQRLGDVDADSADPKANAVTRHDYSADVSGNEPFWVDFVSDLGDGFSSTYSVAYLLAADALRGTETPSGAKIRAVHDLASQEVLPRGRILVMGGDQVYPWPSPSAYAERLQQPYEFASPCCDEEGDDPARDKGERDVFAIPGNHDWYDGLATFDELFCRSRGNSNLEDCNRIGSWFAKQHRSYFAIKLPHNWWIWGADVQLNQQLDVGQLRFFRAVSEQMGPDDKFVLCTAQPSWLQVATPMEQKTRESLRQLIDPPLQKGAKICAIFSGDTHHYSRYNENDELGDFNLFIAGGGGAYFHGTHHLDNEIKMDWVGKKLSFFLNRRRKPIAANKAATTTSEPTTERAAYPSRMQSIRKAASNVLFAGRNWSFAAAMGVIYWLVTWAVAEINVTRPLDARETGGAVGRVVAEYRDQAANGFSCGTAISTSLAGSNDNVSSKSGAAAARDCYQRWKEQLLDLAVEKERDVEDYDRSRKRTPTSSPSSVRSVSNASDRVKTSDQLKEPVRLWIMSEYALFRSKMFRQGISIGDAAWWKELWALTRQTLYMLLAGLTGSPATAFLVVVLYITFLQIADSRRSGWVGTLSQWTTGTLHFFVHVAAMWGLFGILVYFNRHMHAQWYFNCFYNKENWPEVFCPKEGQFYFGLPTFFWEQIIYPVQMIILGGLLAGTIFGLFLALGYILGRTNDDWAFSAQHSPDFRNFLRMKFEPNRLVVYPIGIDRPPRLRTRWTISGWVRSKSKRPCDPRVEPRSAIQPRLIEGPIEIDVGKVRNIPRTPGSS